jgi:glyoxylase-like metal-dependent hydrolase (beta-lactamase superfamily II)
VTEPPLRAAIIPVTPLQQNCTLLWCTKTMRGAFCDPGGDLPRLKAAAQQPGVMIEKIILTHGHIDHCGQAGILAEELGVLIEGPHEDDRVTVGEVAFDVAHCPGHTPGHIVFHHPESSLALVGDVLFKGSVGRWDFPRGDQQQLIRSITTRLWPMGDETAFVPGHGPMSTFGHERATNPYVGDAALAAV